MSPRLKITWDCQYCECDQYYSLQRGTLSRTYICRHPDKEGCWCVLNPSIGGVCRFYSREVEAEVVPEEARG